MIDTHCHLNFNAFSEDIANVLERAWENDVEKIIIPGAKLDSSKKGIEICYSHSGCFASVGIHPHHIAEYEELGKGTIYKNLESMVSMNKVIAVGETGLDYHTYKGYSPVTPKVKKSQLELFLIHLDLAAKLDLPLIIHSRDSTDDLLSILKNSGISFRGVFHCFEGNINQLKQILDIGFYVGFDGNITYSNKLDPLIKYAPLDRILLETDSPYLTPVPFRGKRNEPSYISYILEKISEIKESDISQTDRKTSSNAENLFMF